MTYAHLDVVTAVARHARHRPDDLAIVASDGEVTYRELARRVTSHVTGWRERGLVPGDRLGLAVYDGGIVAELWVAAQAAGLQPVMLSYALREHLPELARRLRIRELVAGADVDGSVLEGIGGMHVLDATDRDSLRRELAPADPDLAADWGSPRPAATISALQFTGGSTGMPKTIVRTVGADWADALGRSYAFRFGEGDRWLMASPRNLGVIAGASRPTFTFGGCLVTLDELTIDAIDRATSTGVTVLPLQTPTWQAALESGLVATLADRGLRTAVATGQLMRIELRQALDRELGRAELVINYGTSETGCIAVARSGSSALGRANCVGRPLPQLTLRLGGTCGDVGELGEIRVRGPSVCAGYLDEAVASPTQVEARRAWDWYETGDVGRLDQDGSLVVLGRKSDTITVDGGTVLPAEVEEAAAGVVGIGAVAVVPGTTTGESDRVVVLTETRGENLLDRSSLEDVLTALLPCSYEIRLVDALPRTIAGKLDRIAARQLTLESTHV